MWAWTSTAPGIGLETNLLSLGLDQERAAIVVNVAGAAVSAGAASLIASRPIAFPWAIGTLWYLLLFVVPSTAQAGPATLPGETIAPLTYTLALVALACCGCAAAGLGVGAGRAVLHLVEAAWDLRRLRSPGRLVTAAGALLLLGGSAFGLLRAPEILLFGPWSGVVVASRPVPQGEQLTFNYWSHAFGRYRSAVVVLPPEYAASPNLAFPVLYLLHGSPGSDLDWARMGAGTIVGEARAAGRLPPTVIVYPDGVGPRGGAEDHWADGYVPGDNMESDLVDDLIPSVEAHFRVGTDARHRAIGGLSSGGYGAANLALRHPSEFGLVMVFGGDLAPEVTAFGADQAALIANDPLREVLGPKPAHAPAFFVGWGASDTLKSENSLFAQRLRAQGYDVSIDVVPGAHTWDVWRRLLLAGLDQTGGLLGKPTPS